MTQLSSKYIQNPLNVFLPLAGMFLLYGLLLWVIAFLVPSYPYPGRSHADGLTAVFTPTVLLALLFYILPRNWNVAGLKPIFMALFILNAFALYVSASINPQVSLSLFIMLNSGALVFVLSRVAIKRTQGAGSGAYLILGLLLSICGGCLSSLVMLDAVGDNWWLYHKIADSIQFQAAPVLIVLGLSAEVLNPQTSEIAKSNSKPCPNWFRFSLALALALTYLLEAKPSVDTSWPMDNQTLAHIFRAAFFALIVIIEFNPFGEPKLKESGQNWRYKKSLNFTLAMVFLGILLPAFWMQFRIAFEHMIFAGGYVWLVVLLISQAVTTNSPSMWEGHSKQLKWFVFLMFLGISTRVTSDIWTGYRPMHLASASLCIIAALIIWALRYRKLLNDSES